MKQMNILDFNGKCPLCGKEIDIATEFKDAISIKEYFISGLCQQCQDIGFSDPDKPTTEEESLTQLDIDGNIQKVEDALSRVVKDIEHKIPKEIFNFDDFYIAGGCIYSIWNNKTPNDYDLFCKNKKAINKIKAYFKEKPCNFVSDNAITYGKYQFITKWYGDPITEVSKFDFKHNMFYYDSKGVHNIVDWSYLNSKKLVFNNLRARDVASVVTRIPKFISRGMELSKSECACMLDVLTSPKNYIKEKVSIKRIKSTGVSGY